MDEIKVGSKIYNSENIIDSSGDQHSWLKIKRPPNKRMDAMEEQKKAHYAAAIFAKHSYKNSLVWLVEENSFTYTKYGDHTPESEKRMFWASQRDKTYYKVVCDRFVDKIDAETAYLIAMGLESAEGGVMGDSEL